MTGDLRSIDLNADLGEGLETDAALLECITSANVATGGHAGDVDTMRRTVRRAAELGVAIGAHISYVDREHFGRHQLDVDADLLRRQLVEQIATLRDIAEAFAVEVRYVKPHGALYHALTNHPAHAEALVAAVAGFPGLRLLAPDAELVRSAARAHGIGLAHEFFADRAYRTDGTLVPRSERGAMLEDPAAIGARVLRWLTTGSVASIEGAEVAVTGDSICVHSDTRDAITIARSLRAVCTTHGYRFAPWC